MIEYCEWCNEMINTEENKTHLALVERKSTYLIKGKRAKQIDLGFHHDYYCNNECFTNSHPGYSLPF